MAKVKKEIKQMVKMKAEERERNFHVLKKDWQHPGGKIKPKGTRMDMTMELERELREGGFIS